MSDSRDCFSHSTTEVNRQSKRCRTKLISARRSIAAASLGENAEQASWRCCCESAEWHNPGFPCNVPIRELPWYLYGAGEPHCIKEDCVCATCRPGLCVRNLPAILHYRVYYQSFIASSHACKKTRGGQYNASLALTASRKPQGIQITLNQAAPGVAIQQPKVAISSGEAASSAPLRRPANADRKLESKLSQLKAILNGLRSECDNISVSVIGAKMIVFPSDLPAPSDLFASASSIHSMIHFPESAAM